MTILLKEGGLYVPQVFRNFEYFRCSLKITMKIRIRSTVFLAAIILGSIYSSLAQVNVGLNDPGINWKQIDHKNYQVIFPESREKEAQRVANLLELLISDDSLTLSHPDIKIPIILQGQDVIPNGFVTLGPWRSEFNLNPPQFQFAGITPWLDMLTIHEYRHVQQVANARVGWAGKLLRTVFGQGGWAFYNRAVQPRWFLEGDAVYAETVYTNGGRGRSADFEREYRAMRLAGLDYHYEKASFRSFKDFVPSHYNLGYHMTTFARRQHGPQVWDDILNDTYSKPGFYRFSKAVKGATGYTTKELYSAAMADLENIWEEQDQAIEPLKVDILTDQPKKVFTNYRFPNYLEDGSLVVQKSSLNQIRTIYKLQADQEQLLFTPGISLSEHFSINAGKMTWSEIRFHPRWSNQTYSVVMVYDFKSGQTQKIRGKSKLTAPSLSPDGKWIAAVETATDGTISLVILEANTGSLYQKAAINQGDFISFPRWSDEATVVVSGRDHKGNFLSSYHHPTKTWKELLATVDYTIDRIFPYDKYVYFASARTGVQNIFALNTSTSEIFQVTNSKLGAFDPAISPDGKKLAYSEYTAMGFQTAEITLTDALWKQPVSPELQGSDYFQPLLSQEAGNILDRVGDQQHQVAPFKYFTKGLLNVHSWYPFVSTEEFGVGVLSKNIMSTLAITGQFTYNTNENSWKTLGRLSFGPFFPILDIDVSTGERQSEFLLSGQDSLNLYVGQWKEHAFAGGIRLPINLTHGNYPTGITISSKYKHYIVDYLDGFTDRARDENFGSVDLDFGFSRAQTRAHQNIYPRWAQTLSVNYQKTLGNGENQGEIFTVNSSLFFPGVVRNHSFFLTGGYQQEDILNAYRFEDLFTNARSYSSFPFERIYRVSANYTLPLWYPDLALGSLLFFKRLRGNLFYDYSEGRLLNADLKLRSYGAELVTDFRLVRLVEIGAGVRLGWAIDDDDYFAEFFITSIQF